MMRTPADSTAAHPIPRQELHLLFTLLTTMLIGAVSRAGGIRLAHQFEQQLNRFTRQHGWNFSASLADLTQGPPDLTDETLLAAYRSSVEYALSLARQLLGERLVHATLVELTDSLTPQLCRLKDRYELFH